MPPGGGIPLIPMTMPMLPIGGGPRGGPKQTDKYFVSYSLSSWPATPSLTSKHGRPHAHRPWRGHHAPWRATPRRVPAGHPVRGSSRPRRQRTRQRRPAQPLSSCSNDKDELNHVDVDASTHLVCGVRFMTTPWPARNCS
jgi:hypothetical protein